MAEENKEATKPADASAEVEEISVHSGLPDSRGVRRSPWSWVPTLYFAEGIPYILVQVVSIIMFKKMGVSNADIVLYTSMLYLPWTIKPLWSPIVDILKTKRWWIILMQLLLAVSMAGIMFCIPMPNFFRLTLIFFWILAFSSATHDIACDGFYMLGLSSHQQAWYVGIRSTFYRIAMITGQGLLVILAGTIESNTGLKPLYINVQTVQQGNISSDIVKKVDLTEEEKAFLENKTPLESLYFYATKAHQSTNIDEVAKFNRLANDVVKKIKEANPKPDELTRANDLASSATAALNNLITSMINESKSNITPLDGDLRLIASTDDITIPVGQIPKPDSDLTLSLIKKWNELQGQKEIIIGKKKVKKEKEPGIIKRTWKNSVVTPLEGFLKENFGQEKPDISPVAGNISVLNFHLSKEPTTEKDIVVTFGRKSGDKTIDLKEGMRFVFNKSNWNKPVKAVIQIDHRLKDINKADFRTSAGNIPLSWMVTFGLMAGLFIIFALYHFFILPHPHTDTSRYEEAKLKGKPFKVGDFVKEFVETFVSFFTKKGIVPMLIYLCFYRFAESQLTGLNTPFYLDSKEAGGLALTTGQVGLAYGTVGLVCLVIGGLLGGFVAARDGLKKWLIPMVIAINIPDVVYVIMAYMQPENFVFICSLVGLETLGYGFGFAAYMLYMIYVAEGPHKTAHFALCTGFMALGMMIPRMPCGWLQSIIGYKHFFIWVMIATIPSFIVTFIIPIDPEFGKKKKK